MQLNYINTEPIKIRSEIYNYKVNIHEYRIAINCRNEPIVRRSIYC